jgi:hypothetical protein
MLLTEGEKKESIFKGNSSLSAEGATHPALRDDNPQDPSFKGNDSPKGRASRP